MEFLIYFGTFAVAVAISCFAIMRIGTVEDRIEEEELKEKRRNGR